MTRRTSLCAVAISGAVAMTLVLGCENKKKPPTTEDSFTIQRDPAEDLVGSDPGGPANQITAPVKAHYGLFKLDDDSGEMDKGPSARFPLNAGDQLGFTDNPTAPRAKAGRYAVAGTQEFILDPSHHYVWRKMKGSYRDAFPFP